MSPAELVDSVITEHLIEDPEVAVELSGETPRYMVRWVYRVCLEQIDTEDTEYLAAIKTEVVRREGDIMRIVTRYSLHS